MSLAVGGGGCCYGSSLSYPEGDRALFSVRVVSDGVIVIVDNDSEGKMLRCPGELFRSISRSPSTGWRRKDEKAEE